VRTGTVLIGKWRIVRELAHGGTSTVYEAVHRNGRRVAVKVLRPTLAADQRGRARFLRESALANRVNHPGVISVIDEDVSPDGLVFLVMELLAGETLEERWTRHGKRLPLADAIAIAADILEPLVAVHRVGIVHRDLKPSNVFLTTHGLKLLDFGVARLREINADEGVITRSGAMLGTPAFMAPEQARGHWSDIDARTDIWAVGAIMFSLLSGRYVHEGRTPNELLIASATQPAVSLARFAPDAPAALVALVDRALLQDKEQRWPDGASMLAELRTIETTVPATAPAILYAPQNLPAPIATLPDVSSAQVSSRRHARGAGVRRAPSLLLAGVGAAVLIVAGVVKSRSAARLSPATPRTDATMARSLQAPAEANVAPPVAQPDEPPDRSKHVAAAATDSGHDRRVRRSRARTLLHAELAGSRPSAASDAVPAGTPEPPRAPKARQTFSGIVVDDDALDQRQ
jgi:serine/threonine protein kinase